MDPEATNYMVKAKKDDGSCVYDPNKIAYEINDNITTPTTVLAKVVRVCGSITISSDLTIMPGARLIMCAGSELIVTSTGSISAIGTVDLPILIKGETETPGFWKGISIKSNNPTNKLIHVTVKDAGTYWGYKFANVYVGTNARLEISNTTISNSDKIGLYFDVSSSIGNFSNNTFSNNTIEGLNIPASLIGKIDSDSKFQNNGVGFIMVRGETVNQDITWPFTTSPCLLTSELIAKAGLTLSPGANIVMEAGSGINVDATGYFTSLGTATNPISIKGKSAAAGYWRGMVIKSNNTENKMANTTVSDGGSYWGYKYSNIHVIGRLEINNSTVKNADSWGVYADNASTIISVGITQTTATGVESNNNLSGNGQGSNANCNSGCTIRFQ